MGSAAAGPRLQTTRDSFRVPSYPPGRFNLSVTKPGHVTVSYGQRRPGSQGTPIQLGDGQKFLTQLQIPRGSVLTGTVLDEFGEATPGTPVRAMRYVTQNGRRTLQSAGNGPTDDRGIFRIYGLQPGDYVVCATPRNTGANVLDQIPREALAIGQNISPLLSILGVAGAEAQIVQERMDAVQAAANQPREEPSTGYAPVCYPGTTSLAQAAPVGLTIAEEEPGVNFQLQLVPLARVEGTVISASGMPLQNVQISLVDAQGRTPLGVASAGRVDANGNFRLTGVALVSTSCRRACRWAADAEWPRCKGPCCRGCLAGAAAEAARVARRGKAPTPDNHRARSQKSTGHRWILTSMAAPSRTSPSPCSPGSLCRGRSPSRGAVRRQPISPGPE